VLHPVEASQRLHSLWVLPDSINGCGDEVQLELELDEDTMLRE
jgi:hypothetical protein